MSAAWRAVLGPELGLLLAVGAIATLACNSSSESDVRLKRSAEKPAVEVVEGSAQLDLGSAKEIEPNNEAAKATPLKLPIAVTGVLASSRDVDYFSFVAAKTGHVRVFLRPADGADFMVTTSSADGEKTRVGDRGPNTGEGIPNLPVVKGETTFVFVSEYVKQPKKRRRKGKKSKEAAPVVREGDSPPYQLEISVVPPPAVDGVDSEREPNDTLETAKEILSGDRPGGYIGWTDDVDYYKLSLDGFGDEDLVEISIDGIDGVTLDLDLSGPDGKRVIRRKGTKGRPIYVRGLSVPDTEYLIAKVSAKRSHESQRYRFHFATRRLGPGDEIEPNDTAKKASMLGEAGDKEGTSQGEIVGSDVDWFLLPKSKTRRLVTATLERSGTVRIELDAVVAGDSLGTLRGDTRDIEVLVEPNARLRFKVTAKGGGAPADYTLSWKTAEAEPAPEPDPLDQLE